MSALAGTDRSLTVLHQLLLSATRFAEDLAVQDREARRELLDALMIARLNVTRLNEDTKAGRRSKLPAPRRPGKR